LGGGTHVFGVPDAARGNTAARLGHITSRGNQCPQFWVEKAAFWGLQWQRGGARPLVGTPSIQQPHGILPPPSDSGHRGDLGVSLSHPHPPPCLSFPPRPVLAPGTPHAGGRGGCWLLIRGVLERSTRRWGVRGVGRPPTSLGDGSNEHAG